MCMTSAQQTPSLSVPSAAPAPQETSQSFPVDFNGLRPDGTSKGDGWLGRLKRPDGRISTEISAGFELNGKEVLVPLIHRGSTKADLKYLLNTPEDSPEFFDKMPKGLIDRAIGHAQERLKKGKSPFKEGK